MVRRFNQDQKRALRAGQLAAFLRQYARTAPRGAEPNDRRYDRAIERQVGRMPPEVLDRAMRGDDEDGP